MERRVAITASQITKQLEQVVDKVLVPYGGPRWQVGVKRDLRGHYFLNDDHQKVRVRKVGDSWVENDGSRL